MLCTHHWHRRPGSSTRPQGTCWLHQCWTYSSCDISTVMEKVKVIIQKKKNIPHFVIRKILAWPVKRFSTLNIIPWSSPWLFVSEWSNGGYFWPRRAGLSSGAVPSGRWRSSNLRGATRLQWATLAASMKNRDTDRAERGNHRKFSSLALLTALLGRSKWIPPCSTDFPALSNNLSKLY